MNVVWVFLQLKMSPYSAGLDYLCVAGYYKKFDLLWRIS